MLLDGVDATTRIEPLQAWITETARRIRLFPNAARYADVWEHRARSLTCGHDAGRYRGPLGEHYVSVLVHHMLAWLHLLLPALEAQVRAYASKSYRWDVFIAHAAQDIEFVSLLVRALRSYRLEVWIDREELTIGDSIRQTIDRALPECQYGVVVFSPISINRVWLRRELDALAEQELVDRKVILPLLHGLTSKEIRQISPLLAGRFGLATDGRTIADIAYEVARAVSKGQTSHT